MKRILVLLALIPTLAIAQSGRIIYEENFKIDMSKQVERLKEMGGMDEMIKKLEESSSKTKRTLVFKDGESLYRNFDADEDLEVNWTSEDGGMEMQIVMVRPESKFYRNTTTGEFVEQQDLFGKQFIIKEDRPKAAWKITGEQLAIGEYVCQKATYTKDSNTVVAWFTTQIPASLGPQAFHGLPGLILKAEARNGQLTIEAKDINLEYEVEEIKIPTKGKEVSRAEFDQIREDKLAEMREMRGGGRGRGNGGMHIEIDRR